MGSDYHHRWRPIQDYSGDPGSLARPELRELDAIWREQRQALEQAATLRDFNERLRREWSIETGLLERVYSLDRGITQLLVEQGIEASLIPQSATDRDPNRVVAILRDHEAVIEGLFTFVKGERELSTSYIKELHSQITRNQPSTTAVDSLDRTVEVPLRRGEYKQRPNNPLRSNGRIHEHCPPEQVASEMDRIIELHLGHEGTSPEVEAAWLHHRFTQIHPFQDGNGRVARCLATLIFLKAGWFPLVIRDIQEERTRYLDSLEVADAGDLQALVDAFVAAQRKAFVQALGISGQVLRLQRPEQVISATRDQLQARREVKLRRWENAKKLAVRLQDAANRRLQKVAAELASETSKFFTDSEFFTDTEPASSSRAHYFRWQVIETARHLGYFANLTEYHAWTRLVMRTQGQAEILLSFHGAGHEFRGILAASACSFRREETEEGEREIADVTPLSDEVFQINYLEAPEAAEDRFSEFLEDVLVKGLEIWRKGL